MKTVFVLLTTVLSCSAWAQTYTISTLAGGGLPVNIPGTSASLGYGAPGYIAADRAGNVFYAAQNSVMRLDATTGVLTLVAGNGTAGFSGDNGPATSAQLNAPMGVAVSTAALYIADTANKTVRSVANGVISAVAGTGTAGSSGDGNAATGAQLNGPQGLAVDSAGSLYIADEGNNRIRKVTTDGIIHEFAGNGTLGYSGDGGPATSATL